MNSQELIDSYVHEVGQQLPRKMRGDIELELRSLLADAVEDRDDEETAVVEFLKALGPPSKFAAQYLPKQFLIGPELFPLFKLVGTIVFSVITVATAAAIGIFLVRFGPPENFLSWWGQEMGEYVRNLIFVFGMLTLIFTVLERNGAGEGAKTGEWDPKSLRPVKDPTRIDRADLIGSIVGGLFTLWVLSELPGWIGTDSGGLFSAGYLVHIPWLVAGSIAEIVLYGAVLINGRWSRPYRIVQVGVKLFDIVVLYRIISGVALLNVDLLDNLVKGALAVALLVVAVECVYRIYRLFITPQAPQIRHRSKAA